MEIEYFFEYITYIKIIQILFREPTKFLVEIYQHKIKDILIFNYILMYSSDIYFA